MSFANLKRNKNTLEKFSKAIESLSEKNSGADDRFWQPDVDKAGNGMAIIRFLPPAEVDGEDGLPWVRIFSHGFQGTGGWFIENCLTTLNEKCPACEHNSTLWNSGIESNKDVVRKQKRKLNYVSNILVVSDPKNPENEGKVFLFKYGKKIFDKLHEAMNPAFEDETAVNPFDFWEGANFKLKIRQVEGYRNYDKSEFESASLLFDGNDVKLEALWKKEYSLKEFLSPTNFKTYNKLKERLYSVISIEDSSSEDSYEAPVAKAAPARKPVTIEEDSPPFDTSGSDDEMDYFKSLADE